MIIWASLTKLPDTNFFSRLASPLTGHRSGQILFLLFLVYGIGSILSRSLMEVAGSLLSLISLLFTLRFLLSPAHWRSPTRDCWMFLGAVLYIVFSFTKLIEVPNPHRLHIIVPDLLFFLIPFLFFHPPILERIRSIFDDRKLSLLLGTLGLCYIASVVMGLYSALGAGSPGAAGFLKITILFAYNHLIGLLFFLTLLRSRKTFGRFRSEHFFWMATLILIGVIASGSRTATMVALLSWLFAAGPWILKKFPRWSLLLFLGLSVLGTSLLYQHNHSFRSRYQGLYSYLTANAPLRSLSIRQAIWDYNWRLFKENPLTGVGYRQNAVTQEVVDAEALPIKFRQKSFVHYAHNQFLQLLAEGGLVGCFLFLMAMGLLIFRIEGGGFLLLGLAAASLTDSPLTDGKMFHAFYFYLLLLTLLTKIRPGWHRRVAS